MLQQFLVCVDSTNKVHYSQVKNHMCENEVCKCSFWADLFKLTLVGRIDL